MKKILKVIIILVIVLGLSSCGIFEKGFDPHDTGIDTLHKIKKKTKEHSLEVLECLDNHDKEGLIKLFSPSVSSSSLSRKIDKLFEIYDSKSVTYERLATDISSHGVKNGSYTYLLYCGKFYNIELENGKKFKLEITIRYVDDKHPDRLGMCQIILWENNNIICVVSD